MTCRLQLFATRIVVALLIFLVASGGMFRGFGPAADVGLTMTNASYFASHSATPESHAPEESNDNNSSEELPEFLRRTIRKQIRLALRCSLSANQFAHSIVAENKTKLLQTPKSLIEIPGYRDRLNGFGGHLLI